MLVYNNLIGGVCQLYLKNFLLICLLFLFYYSILVAFAVILP